MSRDDDPQVHATPFSRTVYGRSGICRWSKKHSVEVIVADDGTEILVCQVCDDIPPGSLDP